MGFAYVRLSHILCARKCREQHGMYFRRSTFIDSGSELRMIGCLTERSRVEGLIGTNVSAGLIAMLRLSFFPHMLDYLRASTSHVVTIVVTVGINRPWVGIDKSCPLKWQSSHSGVCCDLGKECIGRQERVRRLP